MRLVEYSPNSYLNMDLIETVDIYENSIKVFMTNNNIPLSISKEALYTILNYGKATI